MTLRGFLTGLGVVSVCAAISGGFLLFYIRGEHVHAASVVSSTVPLGDFVGYKTAGIAIDGQRIIAAIADTPALQELGLGNRAGLGTDEGMLFIFQVDKKYAFWMKDMYFSIDMIWISASGQIVSMAQDVAPETYPEDFVPTAPARYVLELRAGYAQSHGFKVGDAVRF
jgi:uncharacterized membrane protein (UPF0127 family)